MSERQQIEQAIALYVEAFNTDNTDIIPLHEDVVICGPMMPEPIKGKAPARQYLAETAPFIARMKLNMLVIDGDTAAAAMLFEGVNGVAMEGAYFFRFSDGLICYSQLFFDTHRLFKGAE